MRGRALQIFALVVFLWLLASWGTNTVNPIASLENLLNEVRDLALAKKLTNATEDETGTVRKTVDDLAAEAARTLGSPVSPPEYALARMLRNERTPSVRGGNELEAAAIVWVCMNDAARNNGGDIVKCITGGKGLGKQIGRKYASGRLDPYDVDLELVRRCYTGEIPDPTGGATHFMHRTGFKTRDEYLAVVEKWQGRGWSRVDVDLGTSLEIWT